MLAVTLVDIQPDGYGYTVIAPGFGFMRDEFTEPYLVNWRLDRLHATSDQMPGVAVPYEALTGSVGTLPGAAEVIAWREREAALAAAGGIALPPEPIDALPTAVCGPEGSHAEDCLRTIPPRENGGNIDLQQMQVGTTVLLPCFVDGCGLFVGDVHYAQGDGEVSGTAIEMGAVVTVRTEIRENPADLVPAPPVEGGTQIRDSEPLADLTNLSEDLTLAARNALSDMIDYIVREHGLTREQAYILASVAVDLRIGQVVDVPNDIVTAVLNNDVFVEE